MTITFADIPKGITALVGGGGKTSLLYWLGEQLGQSSRVLLTTSTHIGEPVNRPACCLLLNPSLDEIRAAFKRNSVVLAGKPVRDRKLSALTHSWSDLSELADYVLVEADGAKGLPLKAPAAHEPVIPPETKLVIALAGLDGIGQPIKVCVHRPLLYAKLVNKRITDRVTAQDVATVLQHPEGQKKAVHCSYLIVLNKADSPERLSAAADVLTHLKEQAVVTAFSQKNPIIRIAGGINHDYY